MYTKSKDVIEYALYFIPENVRHYTDLFYLYKIIEKPNGVKDFQLHQLDELYGYFAKKKEKGQIYYTIKNFDINILQEIAESQRKVLKQQKSGQDIEKILDKILLRTIYDKFITFFDFENEIKIYHEVFHKAINKHVKATCKTNPAKVTMQLSIVKDKNDFFDIDVSFLINNTEHQRSAFERFEFLLRKESEYFLLQYDDYQTLNWLKARQPSKFGKDLAEFKYQVLRFLEDKYTLQDNDLLQTKSVDVIPTRCLQLSELSNGEFLVITPVWDYEGSKISGAFQEIHETYADGKVVAIKRNKEEEKAFLNFLKATHPDFSKQNGGYFYLTYEKAKKKNWFLQFYHNILSEDIQFLGLELLKHFRYSEHPVKTVVENLKTEERILSFDMYVSFGSEQIALKELQKIFKNDNRSILLKDNSIGVFPDEWIQEYAPILKYAKIESHHVEVPKWVLLSSDELEHSKHFRFVFDNKWWQKWQKWQTTEASIYPLPQRLQATLRPYQQKGYEWIRLLSEINAGACLADDMGLGKTVQTISAMAAELEQKPSSKILIVCPGSLIYNWKSELEKFLPDTTVLVHHGTQRNFKDFFANYTVCITSYATARIDIDDIKNIYWDIAILDESQNVKNLHAQVTKAVMQLNARNRIALSGTPILNNLMDIYAPLNFLLPGYLGGTEQFREEFANPIEKQRNAEKTTAFKRKIQPFVLRRTKQQVAQDLPPKVESILYCEMRDEQFAVYEEIKNGIKNSLFLEIKNEGLAKSKLSVLQGIIRLRQVCCSPVLLKNRDEIVEQSIKLEMILDEVKQRSGSNKMLIFSQFKEMLKVIGDAFQSENIPYFQIDGDTPMSKRMELVDAFQSEACTTDVFLLSLKTGNAGITLTAADYVYLIDPWWNSAIEQQAIDRTHRIGQNKSVFAYKLICKDTIEEKIMKIQERKKGLSDELITEEENFVKNLSFEDIEFLFE